MMSCCFIVSYGYLDTTTLTGYLVMSINDSKQLLVHTMKSKNQIQAFKDNARLLISLMEPTIEYVVHGILDDASQVSTGCHNFPFLSYLNESYSRIFMLFLWKTSTENRAMYKSQL